MVAVAALTAADLGTPLDECAREAGGVLRGIRGKGAPALLESRAKDLSMYDDKWLLNVWGEQRSAVIEGRGWRGEVKVGGVK